MAGSYSPLLWMMQWFRADMFIKHVGSPLEIQWSRRWLVLALGGVALAVVIARIGSRFTLLAAEVERRCQAQVY